MNFNQLLDYMYEHHRLRRQKDIAKYFGVTNQAISNWKRSNNIPSKFAIKLQVEKPTNYVELVESLSQVLISLNKNIKDIKAMQSISKISAQCFSDGIFSLKNGKPIIKLIHINGDWEKLTGYTVKETIKSPSPKPKTQKIKPKPQPKSDKERHLARVAQARKAAAEQGRRKAAESKKQTKKQNK